MNNNTNWERVDECTTLEELAKVILSLADENGMIQGRYDKYNAQQMADNCINFENVPRTMLTRMWGIRTKAFYLTYKNKI